MRKNNDGYVIIYVVFVILFLCIVAVGTCSSALSNLQNQNRAVEQMKERYTAQGEMEKQVAELCIAIGGLEDTGETMEIDDTADPIESARAIAITHLGTQISGIIPSTNIIAPLTWNNAGLTLTAKVGYSNIVADVLFCIEIYLAASELVDAEDDEDSEDDLKTYTVSYSITNVTSQYISYTIENTGGDAA